MLSLTSSFPAGNLNSAYAQALVATGGTGPYTFALASGSFPPGLALNSDNTVLQGTPTQLGVFNFTLAITDTTTLLTSTELFSMLVMDLIELNNLSVDQAQFVQQFQQVLATYPAWSTGLTTQTSQTLIELISAMGTYLTSKIIRIYEDSFPATAQSDSSQRAIANMQGLRLTRKLPASAPTAITSSTSLEIPPFTQFSGGGYNWFNDTHITLAAGVPQYPILKEGIVITNTINGLGTNLQAWVSPDDQFSVSDQDVSVTLNSGVLNKAFGGLWNYSGLQAYADLTLNDGRLLLQFGSSGYGAVPGVNDVVNITYAKTQGDAVNGVNLVGVKITSAALSTITASFTANPSGGAPERSAIAYKNFSSGTFGTYGSGVTKSQYAATVNNFPGIVDSITQAQRDINAMDVAWMNVMRVSALTNSSWTLTQKNEYITYLQSQTMYSTRFVWQDPIPVPRNINLAVYCFNAVPSLGAIEALVSSAVNKLYAPRPGLLLTNFFDSDLITTALNAAPNQVSYVQVLEPTTPMWVTPPTPPTVTFTVNPASGGTLVPAVYAYAIAVDSPNPLGGTDIGTPTNWVFPQVDTTTGTGAGITLNWNDAGAYSTVTNYVVWGRRAGLFQILATLSPSTLTWTDDGSIADPVDTAHSTPFPSTDLKIRYNTIGSLTVNAYYAQRQDNVLLPIRDVLS